MFKSDGRPYRVVSIASETNNPLHDRIIHCICRLEHFTVDERGFFAVLMEDGTWHRVLTSTVKRIEMPDGYKTVIVHTKNSVYTFESVEQ